MTEHAYAGWLTEDDLRASIDELAVNLTHMILEAVDEVLFCDFHNEIDLRRYETGRIFGPGAEIRWQRDGAPFHTVFLGNVAQVGARFCTHHIVISEETFDRQEKQYYLWGEWSVRLPEWVEASVPHIFNYPSPQGRGSFRRKMTSVEYINVASGELEFYRFTGTQEEEL